MAKSKSIRKEVIEKQKNAISSLSQPKEVKKKPPRCSKFEEVIIIGGLIGNLPGWLSLINTSAIPNILSTAIPAEKLLGFWNGARELIVFILPIIIVILTQPLIRGIKRCKKHRLSYTLLIMLYVFLCIWTVIYIIIKIQGISK